MVNVTQLGGVSIDEIRDLANTDGIPEEAGATLATKFTRRVANLVVTRAVKGESGHFSVFLMSEALSQSKELCDCIECPVLDHGNDKISEHVYIASVTMGSAYKINLEWSDFDQLFSALSDQGLGTLPAIVVDWRGENPIGKLYRSGINERDVTERIFFDQAPISVEAILDAMNNFRETIKTPSMMIEAHGNRVWNNAGKGIPESRPEERLQGRLVDAFKAKFLRYSVRAELVTEDGRADVSIHSKTTSPGNLTAYICEWVLELKALCDMTSTGKKASVNHTQIVVDGLEQAIAYKAKLSAQKGALCCFDMRVADKGEDACFKHISDDAEENDIILWRGFLFRSAKDSRRSQGYINSETT